MQNGIFKLDWASVGDAVLTAFVTGVVTFLVGAVAAQGFNLFTASWVQIGEAAVNLGFIMGVGTLGKALLSTNSGSLLGVGPSSN